MTSPDRNDFRASGTLLGSLVVVVGGHGASGIGRGWGVVTYRVPLTSLGPVLVSSEQVHQHLDQHEVRYLQFAFRWMNNLLMREVPLRCTIRLWDTYQVSVLPLPGGRVGPTFALLGAVGCTHSVSFQTFLSTELRSFKSQIPMFLSLEWL